MIIECPCGEKIEVKPWLIGRKKFCSKKCFYKFKSNPPRKPYKIIKENSGWFKKGVKPWNYGNSKPYFDKNTGYWIISVKRKRIKYHRYVMEKYLGRKLNEEEVVHHKDGDVNNNNINNLELFENKSKHNIHHWETNRRKK